MGHPPQDNQNDMQESLDKVLGMDEEENFQDPSLLEEDWELEDFVEGDPSPEYAGDNDPVSTEESFVAPSRGRNNLATPSSPSAGSPALWGGLILLGLGIAFAALSFLGNGGALVKTLQPIGLEPSMLFLSGVVLVLIGNGQRKASQTLLANIEGSLQQGSLEMEGILAELKETQQQTPQPTAPNGDLQISFNKLENMVVSLTKATRMYNKPLVDLVGMMTDQGKEIEEIRSDLEGLEKAMAENAVTSEKKFEGLVERLRGDTQELEEIFEKSRETLLSELKPFVGQKADQAGEKLQLKLAEDRRILHETFENLGASLESKIKEALSKPKGKDFDPEALHRLESSLGSLLTTVQKIEQEGVKANAHSTAQATPVAAGVTTATTTSTPTPKPTASGSPGASSKETGKDSGTQPAPGRTKKVMSAIEKLKQLRGDG
jgi:hypothetical protein